MKIKEEHINKLNQLDRIEFRQRYNYIYEKYDSNSSSSTVKIFFIGFIFLFTFLTLVTVLGYRELAISLIKSIFFDELWSSLLGICIVFSILISFFSDLLNTLIIHREKEKLINEYFKIELNKEKKK